MNEAAANRPASVLAHAALGFAAAFFALVALLVLPLYPAERSSVLLAGLPLPPLAALGTLLATAVIGAGLGVWSLRRQIRRAMAEPRRLGALFDMLDEGIVICNGMEIVTANTSLKALTGYVDEPLEERLLSTILRDIGVIDRVLSDTDVEVETEIESCAGERIDVEITARSIRFAGEPRRLLEIRDIRERKATQERISFLAHHDPLTGLPNREVLHRRLSNAVKQARQTGEPCAVIWVDLDRFKDVNDVHGHEVGDRLLCEVADKLRFELPADALIVRVGGDEYVVLCERMIDAAEARLVGQQLRRRLNKPIELDGRVLSVGASIGVAVFPDDASDAEELLRNADLALYHAKTLGRGRCRHFNPELAAALERRVVLGEQLRGAIETGDLETWFQPLVRASDGRVAAFEALSRWNHPVFGQVPPTEFVRLAEENGLIDALTDKVLSAAIAAAMGWPDDVRVSVNVSPMQINSGLVDRVREVLKGAQFDPRRLELEVTENILIHDFDQTASMFARLRGLGVHVAMDDFGAGYTSMANLRLLNFDRIKIDRIFTDDLPGHRRSAAIVHAMLVLARELELQVTVEGVENAEQIALLRRLGCDELQGYAFSAPRPLEHWSADAIAAIGVPASDSSALISLDRHRDRRAS